MSRTILLTQGKVAVVDDSDYDAVSRFRWYTVKCKNILYAKTGCSYASTYPNGHRKRWQAHMYLHRFILHPPRGLVIDHVNSNPLDCRRCNMRVCTQAQNTYHRRKTKRLTRSQYIGIKWHSRDCVWETRIDCEYHSYYLGRSRSEIEAAKLYDKGACEVHGEFAELNFPRE